MEVLPNLEDDMVEFTIEIEVAGVVNRYHDVLRRKKLIVMHHEQGQDCSFGLSEIAFALKDKIRV